MRVELRPQTLMYFKCPLCEHDIPIKQFAWDEEKSDDGVAESCVISVQGDGVAEHLRGCSDTEEDARRENCRYWCHQYVYCACGNANYDDEDENG